MKSLFEEIGGVLQRTYRQSDTTLTHFELDECLIGSSRSFQLSALSMEQWDRDRAMTFYYRRPTDQNLALAIYYPDRLIAHLENNDPRQGLHTGNINQTATFVEEISHGVHIHGDFERGQLIEPATETYVRDLEARSQIDTYYMLALILAGVEKKSELTDHEKQWLRANLFETRITKSLRYSGSDRDAANTLEYLDTVPKERRIPTLLSIQTAPVTERQRFFQEIK